MNSRPILIMAGGTGGHVYPALAVANALREQSRNVVWLGTRRGIEARVVPPTGIPVEWVSVQGLRGKGRLALLLAPIELARALWQSLCIVKRYRPAVVLGMGGFVSGPGGLAAWLLRKPLIIHEQNAVSGFTNRLLARLARVVLQAFPGSFSARVNAQTVGNPVRADIAAIAAPAVRLKGRKGPVRLLVLGGSQGALALNRIVPAALALLTAEERPQVRHQAGSRTVEIARETYRGAGVEAQVDEFINDMAAAYSWADLIICRAGALTVAEISAVGLPAIFVPFPSAVDDHQTANAQGLVNVDAAIVIQEPALTPATLAAVLSQWCADREQLAERAAAARSQARNDSLEVITGICLKFAEAAA